MVENYLFELYVDRTRELQDAFPTQTDVALFLAILSYRTLYLANPPTAKLGRFRGFEHLRLPLIGS